MLYFIVSLSADVSFLGKVLCEVCSTVSLLIVSLSAGVSFLGKVLCEVCITVSLLYSVVEC